MNYRDRKNWAYEFAPVLVDVYNNGYVMTYIPVFIMSDLHVGGMLLVYCSLIQLKLN